MAVNRDKLFESAQKHVRKGSWDRAIKDYQQVLESDPGDVRTRLKVADLLVKIERYDEALQDYLKVAFHYASDDIYDKAVAVYKQALRIAPTDPRLHRDLGEAYYRYGRLKDALRAFHQAQKIFRDQGDSIAQRDVLERMVAIDPDDVGLQIQIAERYEKDGERANALMYFRRAANALSDEGRLDEFVQVAERVVFLEPSDHVLRKQVVRLYLNREDNKHALKHLQHLFKEMPEDIETLDMLGMTFGRLGQTEKAILVYLELAKTQRRFHQDQLAFETFRRILALDPNHPEARQVLGVREKQDSSPQLANTGALKAPNTRDALEGVEFLDDDDDEEELEIEPDMLLEPEEVQPKVASAGDAFLDFAADEIGAIDSDVLSRIDDRPASGIAQGNSIQELPEIQIEAAEDKAPSDVRQMVTESEVFLKYRLFDRADDVLTRAAMKAPESVAVHEQLHRLRAMQGDLEGAAEELFILARLTRATPQRATDFLKRAMEFVPLAVVNQHASHLGIALSGPQPARVDALTPQFIEEVSEGIEEISESFAIEIEQPAGMTEVEFLSPDDDDALSGNSAVEDESVPTQDGFDEDEDDEDELDDSLFGDDDLLDIDEVDNIRFNEDELKALDAEVSDPFELFGEDAELMFEQLFTEATVITKSAPRRVNTQLVGDLRDVDSFLDNGLLSEAEDSLERFGEANPGHPGILARDERLRELRGEKKDNAFGSRSLSGKFGPQYSQLSVANVSALAPERMNTNLELGLTYLEMGLWDEAIEEFRQAIDDPEACATAMLHMATCELKRGDAPASENLLKTLLTRPGISRDIESRASEALAALRRERTI